MKRGSIYKFSFILFFLLLTVGRIAISGKGYLEDTDEFYFLFMLDNWESLIKADTETWSNTIFHLWSHLPDNVIRFVQMIPMMWYAGEKGIPPQHPDALVIIGYFNILSSLLLLFIFYKLLRKLGFDQWLSLTGVVLFGTLVSSNIYTRHILQYDHSLIWHLFALKLLIGHETDRKRIMLVGLVAAIGVTSYPPHYMFVAITGGWLFFRYYEGWIPSLKRMLYFLFPFILVVGGIELFCRIDRRSYFAFLGEYGGEGRNIDTYEGFTMLFRYFYHVESFWGLLLLVLMVLGLYRAFFVKQDIKVKCLLGLALGAYLTFSLLTWISSNMVLYGRGIYLYYPFVIISVLYFLSGLSRKSLSVFFTGAFVNYFFVINMLNQINYPRQWIYEYNLEETPDVRFQYKYKLDPRIEYSNAQQTRILGVESSSFTPGKYDLVNICF